MGDIKQFVMANGDEIICEVVEWNTKDDPNIVVRRAYLIDISDDPIRSIRYFAIKPWMMFQSGDDIFNTINSIHIMSAGNPHPNMLRQYEDAIKKTEMTDDELEENLKARLVELGIDINIDSNHTDNIVPFQRFDKDKLH